MPSAVATSHPATMPRYNQSTDLDEAQSLVSDYSFPITSTSTSSATVFSLPQVDSADLLQDTPWCSTADAPQYLPEFQDRGSSYSGDTGEYIFTSGQETPKGGRIPRHGMPVETTWNTAQSSVPDASSHAMARMDSGASGSSSLSQGSNMSGVDDFHGALHGFRQGSLQSAGLMQDLSSCQMSDGIASPICWPGYGLEIGLGTECPLAISDIHPLNVSPSQVTLQPEPAQEISSPNSWDGFSSSISRTSSPATIDETWLAAPINADSPAGHAKSPMSHDSRSLTLNGDVQGAIHAMNAGMPLSAVFRPRNGTEGEDPRRDTRYKDAVRGDDGLFHCPWEGQECCNHKPEKLKCNYDKFVDSHLKPYRCKVKSCEGAQFSSTACRLRHEREAHGLHGHGTKPFLCTYEGCERSFEGNGFPRQWNLRDHMKRVHNDPGEPLMASAAAMTVPLPQQPTKGRKRKTEAGDEPSTDRKAQQKMAPPPAPRKPSRQPLIEQWQEHHRIIQDLIRGMNSPGDYRTMEHIDEVQKRSSEMAKISAALASSNKFGQRDANATKPYSSVG